MTVHDCRTVMGGEVLHVPCVPAGGDALFPSPGLRVAVPAFTDDHTRTHINPFDPSAAPTVATLPCHGVLLEYVNASPECAEVHLRAPVGKGTGHLGM